MIMQSTTYLISRLSIALLLIAGTIVVAAAQMKMHCTRSAEKRKQLNSTNTLKLYARSIRKALSVRS